MAQQLPIQFVYDCRTWFVAISSVAGKETQKVENLSSTNIFQWGQLFNLPWSVRTSEVAVLQRISAQQWIDTASRIEDHKASDTKTQEQNWTEQLKVWLTIPIKEHSRTYRLLLSERSSKCTGAWHTCTMYVAHQNVWFLHAFTTHTYMYAGSRCRHEKVTTYAQNVSMCCCWLGHDNRKHDRK